MSERIWFFLSWLGLLSGVPTVIALARYRASDPDALRKLAFVVGPCLVALSWVHGVFVHLPNNFGALPERGFFSFSFQSLNVGNYQTPWSLLIGLTLLPVVFLLVRVAPFWRRFQRRSALELVAARGGEVRLVLGFVAQVAAGMWLRNVPDCLVEGTGLHGSYGSSASDLREALAEASIVFALAVVPAAIAAVLLWPELSRLKRAMPTR
ncbi:MAG: hypothetical protein ABI548_08390 [Polyangiaceae bacterium]